MTLRLQAHDGAADRLYWWQRAVICQIYPRSFQDSDGDGIGDLPGILTRLDHLSWLGIDAVWLGPIQPSPMADFGYDIADFTAVDPVFGTLDDLDRLIEALHARGIRLVLDFVPNHTSSAHPWFRESRSSRSNPKRDWYVWHDPGPNGGPPNNWLSRFGGGAWECDPATGQYYYHAFLEEQPDLNWRNPEVRRAMGDVLRFWMRRGVDGFRIDAAALLAEHALLRDEPPSPDFGKDTPPQERFRRTFTDSRPESLRYLAELHDVIDKFPDRVALGEVDTSGDRLADFYGCGRRCLDLPLNYGLLDMRWQANPLQRGIRAYLDRLPSDAWPNWVVGSHDKPRIASEIGEAQTRIAAMLLFTLPGTPMFYAGDEIGLRDAAIPPEHARDPFERRVPGYGLNRDPERTPMRWEAGPQAGFTTGEPWLPIGNDVASCNVATQRQDGRSILARYRRLIAFRKHEPALLAGRYEPDPNQGNVLAFRRRLGDRSLLVALNVENEPQKHAVPASGWLRFSTHLDREDERLEGFVDLRPNEGVIVEVEELSPTAAASVPVAFAIEPEGPA